MKAVSIEKDYNDRVRQVGVVLSGVSGTVVLVDPSPGKAVKLIRVDVTTAKLLGVTKITLGEKDIVKFESVSQGRVHGCDFTTHPVTGPVGGRLTLNLPSQATVCISTTWMEV